METLFNLTLYDVKIQKYMSNSLKKKEEEKNPTIYMLTYISIQTPYNKHAKVSGLLSNAFLNYWVLRVITTDNYIGKQIIFCRDLTHIITV